MTTPIPSNQDRAPARNRPSIPDLAFDLIAPTLVFAVYWWIVVRPMGLRFSTIPYFYWQLLPIEAMRNSPWTSLLYLHAQPPVLNLLFALVLKLADSTSLDVQAWATIVMGAISWGCLLAWHAVARRILGSRWLAVLIAVLLASNPAFALFEFTFFYPNMVVLELGILVLLFWRYAQRPSNGRLLAVMAVYGVVIYTRTLWHPIFGVFIALLAGWRLWRSSGDFRKGFFHAAAGIALLMALIAPWSIKNKILFNEGGFTTWLAYNLRNQDLGANALWNFAETGRYDAKAVRAYYSDTQWARLQSAPGASERYKKYALRPEGTPAINMNYFAVPVLNKIGLKEIWAGYLNKPEAYLDEIASNFFLSNLPSYFLSATYDPEKMTYELNPGTKYDRQHDFVYYGSWLIPLTRMHFGWGWFGFNVYAAFWLPLALIGGCIRLRRINSPAGLAWALLLAMEAWLMMIVVLIDGSEGARMRWDVEPAFLLLVIQSLRELAGMNFKKSTNQPGGGAERLGNVAADAEDLPER